MIQDRLYQICYVIGGVVCHQLPERSLYVGGYVLPFCARCFGVYLSVFITTAALLTIRLTSIRLTKRRLPLFPSPTASGSTPAAAKHTLIIWGAAAALCMLPLEADGVGNFLKLWHSNALIRMLTGCAMGGFAMPVIFMLVRGYDLKTARFTPPVNAATLCAAGMAATGICISVYFGVFTHVLPLAMASVAGLLIVPAAFVIMLYRSLL